MMDLVTFVRERLAEREQKTIRTDPMIHWADREGGYVNLGNGELFVGKANATHVAANDPAYVLRDIAAKRAIVDEYEACATNSAVNKLVVHALEWTVEKLAAIDSDHSDCDPKWRRLT